MWSWWCSSWSDNGEQTVPSAYHQHGKPLSRQHACALEDGGTPQLSTADLIGGTGVRRLDAPHNHGSAAQMLR